MDKRTWAFAVLLPLVGSWGIDRITKLLAAALVGINWYGPVGLVLHHNHGAIMGIFSELPALLRVVSLATGGAFLLVAFFIIQYLLPTRSTFLRAGMSFLMGGILGNVTDRILTGYVVDFVVLGTRSTMSPAFNFADAIQWVGYLMIVYALLRDGKNLWPENNSRKSYWINVKYQMSYCIKLVGIGIAFSLIAGTYCYTYFKVMLIDLTGHNKAIEDRFLIPYISTLVVITASLMVILFLVGLIFSHRSAGPIYAFERFLEDLFNGKARPLKLRAGDELRHLEELAERISKMEIIVRDRDPNAVAPPALPPIDVEDTENKSA